MSSKTTQRSMEKLRNDGWTIQVVEKWNPFARVRQDLYGFIDILAMCGFRGIMGVQTTTVGEMKRRLAKIAAEPRAKTFLKAGGHIEVHGWKKLGKRSGTPGKWVCITERVINVP